MWWLLELTVFQNFQRFLAQGFKPDAEKEAQFLTARLGDMSGAQTSRILSVAGDNAQINIDGVLTKAPSFLAMLFGGGNTAYTEIISALSEAEQNPSVRNITLAIDSPGGQFDGLFEVLAALESVEKPMKAVVSGVAASAAYAIAAQADEIIATNPAARFGSVGVAATIAVDENEVTITSSDAPNKRPDVTTEEGIAMVREELDAMHAVFVDAIAAGRNTTAERINSDFGKGATLLAEQALSRGMIDTVEAASLRLVSDSPSDDNIEAEGGPMNLQDLRAQYPETYAQAVQAGVDQERDRVAAHLTMGEASGDMPTAVAAINDGSEMTTSLQAKYLAAGMNRNDVNARQGDDASAADAGGTDGSDSASAEEQVLAVVESRLGVSA